MTRKLINIEKSFDLKNIEKKKALATEKEVDIYYKNQERYLNDVVNKFKNKKNYLKIKIIKKKISKLDKSVKKFESLETDLRNHLSEIDLRKKEFISSRKEILSEKKNLLIFISKIDSMKKEVSDFSKIKRKINSDELTIVQKLEDLATGSRLKFSGVSIKKLKSTFEKIKKKIIFNAERSLEKEFNELYENENFLKELISPIEKKEVELGKIKYDLDSEEEKTKRKLMVLSKSYKKVKSLMEFEENKINSLKKRMV